MIISKLIEEVMFTRSNIGLVIDLETNRLSVHPLTDEQTNEQLLDARSNCCPIDAILP